MFLYTVGGRIVCQRSFGIQWVHGAPWTHQHRPGEYSQRTPDMPKKTACEQILIPILGQLVHEYNAETNRLQKYSSRGREYTFVHRGHSPQVDMQWQYLVVVSIC